MGAGAGGEVILEGRQASGEGMIERQSCTGVPVKLEEEWAVGLPVPVFNECSIPSIRCLVFLPLQGKSKSPNSYLKV